MSTSCDFWFIIITHLNFIKDRKSRNEEVLFDQEVSIFLFLSNDAWVVFSKAFNVHFV